MPILSLFPQSDTYKLEIRRKCTKTVIKRNEIHLISSIFFDINKNVAFLLRYFKLSVHQLYEGKLAETWELPDLSGGQLAVRRRQSK